MLRDIETKTAIKRTLFLLFIFSSSLIMASEMLSKVSKTVEITWHEWNDTTFTLAKKQNKPVLLDISAQWCQFCKKMKAITYQDPEVIQIINENYIAIKADIEFTAEVKKRYGHFGVPGTVVLTADRKEINKRLGYIPPQQMQWHLLGSLQDISTNKRHNTQITQAN